MKHEEGTFHREQEDVRRRRRVGWLLTPDEAGKRVKSLTGVIYERQDSGALIALNKPRSRVKRIREERQRAAGTVV